jgi:hypothetical protein
VTLRERLMVLTDAGDHQLANPGRREERIRTAAALEASSEAQIVVDAGGQLAIANAKARHLFNLGPDDIGRPFQDLELSYRPRSSGRTEPARSCSWRCRSPRSWTTSRYSWEPASASPT